MAQVKKKSTFSMMVLLLIPIAIAINLVGGQLTSLLKLPIDLDMIGVILIGALAGPIPAAITGVLTNLINGIFDPTWIPYAGVSLCIGLATGFLAKYNMMTKVWKVACTGLILALLSVVTATPITVYFFGGSTGGGGSVLAAGLMAAGFEILKAVASVYLVTEIIGKLISVFVAFLIIKALPARTLIKYPYGEKYFLRPVASASTTPNDK